MIWKMNKPLWAPDGEGGGGGDGGDAAAAAAAATAAAAAAAAAGNDTLKGGGDDTLAGGGTALAKGAKGDDTLAGGAKGNGAPGDDWRDQLAGDNVKFRKELDRFTDWRSYALSAQALKTRLSAGELRAPFPVKGTDAEKQAWRETAAYPDKPEALLEGLDKGEKPIVIGEEDKPLALDYVTRLHAAGMPKEAAEIGMRFYFDNQAKVAGEMKAQDETEERDAISALTVEWGKDTKTNFTMNTSLLDLGPKAVAGKDGKITKASFKDRMMHARMGDGTMFGNDPDAMKWLNQIARQSGMSETMIPDNTGGGANFETELATLKGEMSNRKLWFKPENAAKRARYEELVGWKLQRDEAGKAK